MCIVESQHYLHLAEHSQLMPSLWRTLSLSTYGSNTLGWMSPLRIERNNHFILKLFPHSPRCLCTPDKIITWRFFQGSLQWMQTYCICIDPIGPNTQLKKTITLGRLWCIKLDKVRALFRSNWIELSSCFVRERIYCATSVFQKGTRLSLQVFVEADLKLQASTVFRSSDSLVKAIVVKKDTVDC